MLEKTTGIIADGLNRVFARRAELGLYCVRVHLGIEKEGISDHFIRGRRDIERFLKAILELHFEPGINPHITDRDPKTAEVQLVAIAPFSKNGPYWWSTPGLQENYDHNGASVYTSVGFDAVWVRPGTEVPSYWGYKTE